MRHVTTTPITSRSNDRLKELRRLHERKHRERSGLFVAEGEDLLSEALRFGVAPRAVFYDADRLDEANPLLGRVPAGCELVPVAGAVLESASALGSGSRMISLFERPPQAVPSTEGLEAAVYLHEVADPGNVGTVLRSALALTSALVILSPRCADPFGPKAVRASMGAVFGQPMLLGRSAGLEGARELLGDGWAAVALVPASGVPLRELPQDRRSLYCLGSERLGLPPELAASCDVVAHIPVRPGTESLNVAVTASICLYATMVHRLSSA